MAVNRKAVFLDKDGTLVRDVPYNVDPARIRLFDDAVPSLKQLQAAGFSLFIVSNQSGVARGLFDEEATEKALQHLQKLLEEQSVHIEDYFYCPHLPDGNVAAYRIACDCRKPAPGMLDKAAKTHQIDLEKSWMVGDILDDVEAGNRAGCRSILVDNGGETEWKAGAYRIPTATVSTLREAADTILTYERRPHEKPATANNRSFSELAAARYR